MPELRCLLYRQMRPVDISPVRKLKVNVPPTYCAGCTRAALSQTSAPSIASAA